MDFKTLISIYYALFESHVSYCLQTIGFITQAFLEKIEVLQNKALRIIHFKPPRESARPLYVKAAILPIRKLLKVKNCLLAHDFVKRIIPSYFSLNFLRLTPNQEATRQSSLRLEPPTSNTVRYGSFNIATLVTKDWNELHSKLKINIKKDSKATFKKHLHRFLLTKLAET